MPPPPPPAAPHDHGDHGHGNVAAPRSPADADDAHGAPPDHHHHHHPASLAFPSAVIHGGQRVCPTTGALMTPIYLSSTYAQAEPGVHQGFEYSRSHNPTRYALERAVAHLEGTGLSEAQDVTCGGFAFASGLAATATVLELLAGGATVVCGDDVYGGTYRLLHRVRASTARLDVRRVDFTDLAAAERAICGGGGKGGEGDDGDASGNNSKVSDGVVRTLVWLETPTNPTLKLADIAAVAALCARSPGTLLAVDNTFATAALTRPLSLGADVVVSSSTKYLNGHSDAVGGVAATRHAAIAERLRFLQNAVGAVMAPFDSYLTLRGVKTLHVRVARHCANALDLARRLEAHPRVERVAYPGLPSHPQHALAARQMRLASASAAAAAPSSSPSSSADASAFGGMIAVTLKGGLPEARAFLSRLRLFALAESLGGVESLAEHPAIMTHASVPAAERAALGIADGFVRLSVGIEHVEDLWADLEAGLGAAAEAAAGGAKGGGK
jgi:cystathionine gamma-lyase